MVKGGKTKYGRKFLEGVPAHKTLDSYAKGTRKTKKVKYY